MIVVFVAGIHFLLITIYAYLIMTKRSRLSFAHLLLALFIPFAGELCLIAAEFGRLPPNPIYKTGLKKKESSQVQPTEWECPNNWREIILGEENSARELLMGAIDSENKQLPEILKESLHSSSSEVCHIAASRLMKMHRFHEDAIAAASEASKKRPLNMSLLLSHIDAINAYRLSGLPDKLSYGILKGEEISLLKRYTRMMPNDNQRKKQLENLLEAEALTQ